MSHHARRILTPDPSRKRKERESTLSGAEAVMTATKPSASLVPDQAAAKPAPDNRLLAGYMAYEFLTKGTLLGRRFNPARAEAGLMGPPSTGPVDLKRVKEHGSYGEVARILKTEGAHIPGIVNPTQLARWIQM